MKTMQLPNQTEIASLVASLRPESERFNFADRVGKVSVVVGVAVVVAVGVGVVVVVNLTTDRLPALRGVTSVVRQNNTQNTMQIKKTPYRPEIGRVLTLSTCHVPKNEGVHPCKCFPWIAGSQFVAIYSTVLWRDKVFEATYPYLSKLIRHARKQGCDYLQLHADGPINPRLKRFDW